MKQSSFMQRLLALLFVLAFPAAMLADAPAYTGTAFDNMQEVLDDGALFFGALIAVAIIIIGFLKGRAWFKRV